LRGIAFVSPSFDCPGGRHGQARTLAEALARHGVPITYATTRTPGVTAPAVEVRGLVTVYRLPGALHDDPETTLGLLELFALGVFAKRQSRLNLVYGAGDGAAVAARVAAALELPAAVKVDDRAPTPGASRAVTIRDGVDLGHFRPRATASQSAQVLCVGPLDYRRRLDVLVEAFASLARPELKLVLACRAGHPSPPAQHELRAELERQARALGVGDSLHFLETKDTLAALRAASVLALPSPLVFLEGLATGVPVVAFETSETSAVGAGGSLLTPPRDAAALTAALTAALGDSRQLLIDEAKEHVKTFDIQDVAADHVALFNELGIRRDDDPASARPLHLGHALRKVSGAAARAGARTSAAAVRGAAKRTWKRLRGLELRSVHALRCALSRDKVGPSTDPAQGGRSLP
jgi:hypothetical protein